MIYLNKILYNKKTKVELSILVAKEVETVLTSYATESHLLTD